MTALKLSFILATGLLLTAFAEIDRSNEVDVQVVPAAPLVFTAPFSYVNNSGHTVQIAAPWIRFQVQVKVPTTIRQPVTVVHVETIVQAKEKASHTLTTMEAGYDPMTDNYASTAANRCKYTYYGTFTPGGEPVLLNELDETGSGTCAVGPQTFWVSLPANGDMTKYDYNLIVTPEGWFGTIAQPVSRFLKSVSVSLQ